MLKILLVITGFHSALAITCDSSCMTSNLELDPMICNGDNPCYSSDCNWHNFKCLKESCSKYDFANGNCDESCNSDILNFDSLDCHDSSISELYITAGLISPIPKQYSNQILLSLSSALKSQERYLRIYLSKGYHFFSETFTFPSISKIIRISPWMCESISYGNCFHNDTEIIAGRPRIRFKDVISINSGAWSELILDNLVIDGTSASKNSPVLGKSMFEIGEYARLILNYVTIQNVRIPYSSIIRFESSSYVALKFVDFKNIHLSSNHTNSAIISSVSSRYSTEGEFIYFYGQILNSNIADSVSTNSPKIPLIYISNFNKVNIISILVQNNLSTTPLIQFSSIKDLSLLSNIYSYNQSPYIISSLSSNLLIDGSTYISNTSQDLYLDDSTVNIGTTAPSDFYSYLTSPNKLVYILPNNTHFDSGQSLPSKLSTHKLLSFNFAILDGQGNRMITEYNSIGSMSIYKGNNLLNTIIRPAYGGYFNFTTVLSYAPNEKLMIVLRSGPLDFYTSLTLEECKLGEEEIYNGCKPCGISYFNTKAGDPCTACDDHAICKGGEELPRCIKGYYSLESEYDCKKCESDSICPGGSVKYPKPGYWRDSKHSDMYKCLVPEACLGGEVDNSTQGVCKSGYSDKLCHSCQDNYQRLSNYECQECQEGYQVILPILLYLCIIVLYLFTIIKSSIRTAYSSESTLSIALKIFTNYIQVMTIISYFDFEWSKKTQVLFNIQRAIFDTTDRVYTLDCLTDNNLNSFFTKIILVVIQPIIIISISTLIWILSNIRSKVEHLKEKIIGSITVILFWIHPFVLKYSLSSFSCKEIQGEDWLYIDLEIKCWEGDHMIYAMAFGLSGLVIWGLSLPAIFVILLNRNKDKLEDVRTKLKYGFLYNGYNHKHYYWEVFIVYRKVMLVTCAVFLRWENQALTVTVVHFVVFVHLGIERQVRPYVETDMNRLDIYSLVVILATVYSAILQATTDLDASSENNVFIIVALINSMFVMYWIHIASLRILTFLYKRYEWCRKFIRKLPKYLTQSFKFIENQDNFAVSPEDILSYNEDKSMSPKEDTDRLNKNSQPDNEKIDFSMISRRFRDQFKIGQEGVLSPKADDSCDGLIFNAPFSSIIELFPIEELESDIHEPQA